MKVTRWKQKTYYPKRFWYRYRKPRRLGGYIAHEGGDDMKGADNLYLGQDFKRRDFPKTKKVVEMRFRETPLFQSSQPQPPGGDDQLTLFQEEVEE